MLPISIHYTTSLEFKLRVDQEPEEKIRDWSQPPESDTAVVWVESDCSDTFHSDWEWPRLKTIHIGNGAERGWDDDQILEIAKYAKARPTLRELRSFLRAC